MADAVPRPRITDILQKLLLLERRLGDRLELTTLSPIDVNPRDPIALQHAARTLAAHVGLDKMTFVVSMAKQDSNVGGHVELRYAQSEVFIELDSTLEDFPKSALAALAHEVSHKLLHEHQIWIEPTLENERLTDIAAVYAGFGAMLINGCHGERVITNGQTRTVHTFKGGYLDQAELGITCAALELLRGEDDGSSALDPDARRCVEVARAELASVWPRPGRTLDKVAGEVRDVVQSEQAILAALAKDIIFMRDHVLPALESLSTKSHRRLCEVLAELVELEDSATTDRVQMLLAASATNAAAITREGIGRKALSSRAQKRLRKAASGLESVNELPTRTTEMFRVVHCGVDGTRLRIPANKKRVAVRCPRCGYKFIADSTIGEPEVSPRRGSGWFRRR